MVTEDRIKLADFGFSTQLINGKIFFSFRFLTNVAATTN